MRHPVRLPTFVVVVGWSAVIGLAACGGSGATSADQPFPKGQNLVVEGTIVGLQGSGLVLQNNGAGDLTPGPGALGFFFPGIAEKSNYSVTVKTQPTNPSQLCTVSAGSGKIVYDPIRNVVVTCVTQSFVIRGGVSGLTATGLTVLLNGGSVQTVAPGANTFAFAALPSGSAYSVTIGTQPTGQTCTVNGGSGTVGAIDVTNVQITCTSPGLTISGTVIGLGSNGLTLRLNGGTPIPIAGGASTFSFPTTLQPGSDYSLTVVTPPVQPPGSCYLVRGKGRVGTANVTDVVVRCFSNGFLDSYTGTYALDVNGRRNFLTLWFDGTFSFAARFDDPSCTNAGNGVELGVYRRTTAGAFYVQFAADFNGGCGLWGGGGTPGQGGGVQGTMVREGNALTLGLGADGTFVLQAVESVPTSLVGSFTRADGQDGSFIVFQSDGTYLYQDAQGSSGALVFGAGYERGCYTISGGTFTTTLAATCKPNGLPALDLNGVGGFSGRNGAPIPFVIASPTTITIDGVLYNRIVPAG